MVRNENEIILPGQRNDAAPRPRDDRRRAGRTWWITSSATGKPHATANRSVEYLRLLRQMGYTRTEGYLWYVRLGRTERVEEKED